MSKNHPIFLFILNIQSVLVLVALAACVFAANDMEFAEQYFRTYGYWPSWYSGVYEAGLYNNAYAYLSFAYPSILVAQPFSVYHPRPEIQAVVAPSPPVQPIVGQPPQIEAVFVPSPTIEPV